MHPLLKRVVKVLQLLWAEEYLRALHRGVAAAIEHESLLRSIDCATVVDVGANRGQFALVARRCFPTAKIISFEPLSDPVATYCRVFQRDERTTIHRAAIGLLSEMRMMHISRCDDSSSLLPISCTQTAIFPGTQEVSTLDVRVAPLDEFVSAGDLIAPAMLKLDVQGSEHEALMGCESLLHHFTFVYCECSFLELYTGQKLACDVIDWLSVRGFKLAGFYNPHYDRIGKAVQADFLFKRDKNN
jgi:FkbM family methyltransferase